MGLGVDRDSGRASKRLDALQPADGVPQPSSPRRHAPRDDAFEAQAVEQVEERLTAVLDAIEACFMALAHVRVGLDGAPEVAICVPPRSQPADVRLDQLVLFRHAAPDAW